MHLGQWFRRRKFLKLFAKTYIKLCPLKTWPFVTPWTSFVQLESPGPKDVPCQIPMHLNKWFMRSRFLKICQLSPLFGPLNGPQGASPFILTKLNPHSIEMLPTKLV